MQIKLSFKSSSLTFSPTWFALEILIFISLIIYGISVVWSQIVFPTMDGPSHLHNSYLLGMLETDPFINQHYKLNSYVISNYLSHLLLNLLSRFLDPFIAEKILVTLIVCFLPITFMLLVKTYNRSISKNYLYLIIIPFVFNHLLILGFYNFNLGFIFLNLQLLFLHKLLLTKQKTVWRFLFILNSILLFYSHAFVFILAFVATGLVVFCYEKSDIKSFFKKSIHLLIISLPSFALFLYFATHLSIWHTNEDIALFDKFIKALKGAPFILLGSEEAVHTKIVVLMLAILTLATLLLVKIKNIVLLKNPNTAFLLLSIILFGCYMFMKDNWAGGILSMRLLFAFFYFLAIWIGINGSDFKALRVFVIIVVIWHYTQARPMHKEGMRVISAHAKEVSQAAKYIEPHTYIYAHRKFEVWLEVHLDNLLAVNKPVVMLNNYEARLSWFPLNWKDLAKIDSISNAVINYDSLKVNYLPDYVAIIGETDLSEASEAPLKACLKKHGQMVYVSENKYCTLYKINKLVRVL